MLNISIMGLVCTGPVVFLIAPLSRLLHIFGRLGAYLLAVGEDAGSSTSIISFKFLIKMFVLSIAY